MAVYKALYRKWRPKTFDDVISQNYITDTLKNQIKTNKTAHAYLFTGSRGTGKTTCARIFAKALCCPNSVNGNPCLECEVCKDAESSKISDIIEIDAASNNSVEDVRDLREGAIYLPERCKYKVYIIDEVHMLSPNAFNALLKIMEEPPEFVKFILATTELHKVPATILSRCQRFDFKRILPEDISNRLNYIADNEGFNLHQDASFLIAKLSEGGMRDAISLLDQCSAFSNDITEEVVSLVSGIAGKQYLFNALEYIINKDTANLFKLVDDLYIDSKDLTVFCNELLTQLRNVMILKLAPNQESSIVCMPNELQTLKRYADTLSLDDILYIIHGLEDTNNMLSKSNNRRIELEICLANVCNQSGSVTNSTAQSSNIDSTVINKVSDLLERINRLENRVAHSMTIQPQSNVNTERANARANATNKKYANLNGADFTSLSKWEEIVNILTKENPAIAGLLGNSKAYVHKHESYVMIVVNTNFFCSILRNNATLLKSIIDRVLNGDYTPLIRCNDTKHSTNNNNNYAQNTTAEVTSIRSLVEKANSLNVPTSQLD